MWLVAGLLYLAVHLYTQTDTHSQVAAADTLPHLPHLHHHLHQHGHVDTIQKHIDEENNRIQKSVSLIRFTSG